MTLGRRGQSTRLDLDREALRQYVEAGPSAPPWTDGLTPQAPIETDTPAPPAAQPEIPPAPLPATTVTSDLKIGRLRVFISHSKKDAEIVGQVQSLLTLAQMDTEVAEAEETAAIPVPEKVFDSMHRSDAAIIAVTVDEGRKDSSGKYGINENVLIEIGAAFVLYQRQVVLLWDKRVPVPSNLQGLYRCEFEGNELTWSAGMKLSKAIQNFKKRS